MATATKGKIPEIDKRELFVAELEKQFGRGIVMTGKQLSERKVARIPFGILHLDYITRGGIPAERITMIHGREGGTKSTTALMLARSYLERCAACYKAGGCKCKGVRDSRVVYLDAELKCETEGIAAFGIDFDRFALIHPMSSEQAIDILEKVLRDESVGFVVIDSLAALCPQVEIDSSATDWQQGVVAREMNKLFRKMLAAMMARTRANTAPTVVIINQERTKIGIVYGNPLVLPGGAGQRFATWLTMRFSSVPLKTIKDNPHGDPILKVSATVGKHAYGPSGQGVEYILAMGPTSDGLQYGEARDSDLVLSLSEDRGFIKRVDKGWLIGEDQTVITSADLKADLVNRGEIYSTLRELVFGSGLQ